MGDGAEAGTQSSTSDRWEILLEKFRSLNEERASRARHEAPEFNLFKRLPLERQECVHSAFLRDLLDPLGSHAQGDIFLRAFLEHCQSTPGVYGEVPTALGRPDLLILLEGQFAVVIENKIDAPPGKDQLKHYREWLDKQPEARKGATALLYLTPGPTTEEDLPPDCFPISYRDDVSRWIEQCTREGKVASPRVLHSLHQYLEVISALCAEDKVKSPPSNSPLSDFMKNNALDISELWQAFIRELGDPQNLFWTKLAENTRGHLPSKRDGWTAFNLNQHCLAICESERCPEGLHCHFYAQDYHRKLQHGIAWSRPLSREEEESIVRESKEAASLREDLRGQDFKRQQQWWLAWKYMNENLDERALVIDRYSGDHFQRLVAKRMIDLFKYAADRVRKINETLRKKGL